MRARNVCSSPFEVDRELGVVPYVALDPMQETDVSHTDRPRQIRELVEKEVGHVSGTTNLRAPEVFAIKVHVCVAESLRRAALKMSFD